jgi:hypothetical protein
MTQFTHDGGDDDQQDAPPVVAPDADSPGSPGGDYTHPDPIPGDDIVDNSQLGG